MNQLHNIFRENRYPEKIDWTVHERNQPGNRATCNIQNGRFLTHALLSDSISLFLTSCPTTFNAPQLQTFNSIYLSIIQRLKSRLPLCTASIYGYQFTSSFEVFYLLSFSSEMTTMCITFRWGGVVSNRGLASGEVDRRWKYSNPRNSGKRYHDGDHVTAGGVSCISRTSRRWIERTRKYHPAWLRKR